MIWGFKFQVFTGLGLQKPYLSPRAMTMTLNLVDAFNAFHSK